MCAPCWVCAPQPDSILAKAFCDKFLAALSNVMKRNRALNHFFQSDPRRLVFGRIDLNARAGAALELLAAFGRQNNQTILGINLWSLRLFRYLVNLFVCGCHQACLPPN